MNEWVSNIELASIRRQVERKDRQKVEVENVEEKPNIEINERNHSVHSEAERDLKLTVHKLVGNCFLDDSMMKHAGWYE